MARNHLSKRHRLRRFRRVKALLTERCATCRRRLDPHFRWDKDHRPHCSRHT